MTIHKLIQILNSYPEDLRVVIPGYEGGFNDVSVIKEIRIIPDYHKEWWYGQHLDAEDFLKLEEFVI